MPFCRAHANKGTKYREPWTFGDKLCSEIRDILRLRYEILPYIYTCFYKSRDKNEPLMRPLWFNYPSDPNTNMIEDQFCLGEDILMKALTDEGQESFIENQWIETEPVSLVYLPKGDDWVSLEDLTLLEQGKLTFKDYERRIIEGG